MTDLSSFVCEENLEEWHRIYSAKLVKGEMLTSMGAEFAKRIRELGAFSVSQTSKQGTRALPHRQRCDVIGYFVEPISLGHHVDVNLQQPYTEQAALLRTVNCSFRSKKLMTGVGYCGLALPRHVLERIYERTEISREDFPTLIAQEFDDLLKGMAVARTIGIAISEHDGTSPYWMTAVPFSEGLMILKARFVYGNIEDGEFGFRLEIPSGSMNSPYASPLRMLGEQSRLPNSIWTNYALLDCGVTYFNSLTLSDVQADYFYKFQNFKNEIGDELLAELAHHDYYPRLPHEPHKVLKMDKAATRIADDLRRLAQSGWLKPKNEYPASLLLPYDHQMPKR